MKHGVTWALATATVLLGACDGELYDDDSEPGPVGQAESSLTTNSIAGNVTGLVGRLRHSGRSTDWGCSAVFLPNSLSSGGDSNWALTNEHCIEDFNYTNLTVSTVAGAPHAVDRVYFHPLAAWYLGDVDNVGKVDIALLHLTTTANVNGDPVIFSVEREVEAVVQESARRNGTWTFAYAEDLVSPHGTYTTRLDTSLIATEGGDSGGPLWNQGHSGFWILEGIHSSSGHANDAIGFRSWVLNALACGAFDTSNPDDGFCSPSCPCAIAEGDCDNNLECQPGLTCTFNVGETVGLPSDYDLCLDSGTPQRSSTSGYCALIGGCGLYEGDCNSNDDCLGDLVCVSNIGAAVGLTTASDVCDLPRMPGTMKLNASRVASPDRDNTSNYCSVAHPCVLGDGDCDPNDDDTCRGILRCKGNVGLDYGFTNAGVDVCVHPDAY